MPSFCVDKYCKLPIPGINVAMEDCMSSQQSVLPSQELSLVKSDDKQELMLEITPNRVILIQENLDSFGSVLLENFALKDASKWLKIGQKRNRLVFAIGAQGEMDYHDDLRPVERKFHLTFSSPRTATKCSQVFMSRDITVDSYDVPKQCRTNISKKLGSSSQPDQERSSQACPENREITARVESEDTKAKINENLGSFPPLSHEMLSQARVGTEEITGGVESEENRTKIYEDLGSFPKTDQKELFQTRVGTEEITGGLEYLELSPGEKHDQIVPEYGSPELYDYSQSQQEEKDGSGGTPLDSPSEIGAGFRPPVNLEPMGSQSMDVSTVRYASHVDPPSQIIEGRADYSLMDASTKPNDHQMKPTDTDCEMNEGSDSFADKIRTTLQFFDDLWQPEPKKMCFRKPANLTGLPEIEREDTQLASQSLVSGHLSQTTTQGYEPYNGSDDMFPASQISLLAGSQNSNSQTQEPIQNTTQSSNTDPGIDSSLPIGTGGSNQLVKPGPAKGKRKLGTKETRDKTSGQRRVFPGCASSEPPVGQQTKKPDVLEQIYNQIPMNDAGCSGQRSVMIRKLIKSALLDRQFQALVAEVEKEMGDSGIWPVSSETAATFLEKL